MRFKAAIASLAPQQWSPRGIAWIGGLFIAAIVALAMYDVVRGYRNAVTATGREVDSQARVIAEQTARSVQAIDLILRHLADQFRRGPLATMTAPELHAYLQELVVGFVQIDGLGMFDASGRTIAASRIPIETQAAVDVSGYEAFKAHREKRDVGLFIDNASKSVVDGQWFFPIARRLELPSGEFAGIVAGRGRIDYFQQFYRDVRLDEGTTITLMHQNGTLLARYPPVESALGKHFPRFNQILASLKSGQPTPTSTVSPLDGAERFVAYELVPGYPLAVIATRDASAALAAWREQAIVTGICTFALAALAALLIGVLMRQLGSLYKTRESLEVSQERYALAVAGSDDGLWDYDFRTNEAFVSAKGRELYGLPPYPETQPIHEWFASLQPHPDDAPHREALLKAHLAGETPAYEGEWRLRRADGSYRWFRVRGVCVRDAAGKPYRMAGSVSDIDARKRAEHALRQSEERYAIAMTGSNEAHWVWDLVTDEMYASPMLRELYGISPDESLLTRTEFVARIPVHPEDRAAALQRVRDHIAGLTERLDSEYRIVDGETGEIRWIHTRGQCFRDADGKAVRFAGATVDVSQRKRAEEALRESENALRQSQERYQLAVAGSNQGVWDWDLINDTMFISQRAQEFMGLEPSEPLRPRREWIAQSVHHPDDVAGVRAAISAHLRGETPHYAAEYRVRHRSGEWHWYRQRGVALRDAQGKPYRMAGSMEDITDRKNAEAERARLERQLLQSKKLESMGTLAGGIAHDFNNILSAILGYGEMAQKDAAEGTSLRRHIDAAMSAGMRAKSLVERILAFSRSGMGERVPVHVQSVVFEALELVAASAPPGIRLECELVAGDAAVMGDPTQVHQVVMNLCTNAIQSMKSHGTLTVSLDLVQKGGLIAATSVLPGGLYVRLKVRDTGAGIPAAVLDRIFDPFFTTKGVGVGTGLGLSLVHGIVTDLGGGIDVDSRPGEGATFTVYLPWQSDIEIPAKVDEIVANGSGETVLLVDDEESLVRLGEEMIAELGYEPVGFTSGNAALEMFRVSPQRFDAVLSDEAMPEMTGSELAKEIRKLRPDIPIVLMSGYVSATLSARAREAGVIEVLSKPLVSRDIARSLAGALATSKSRSAPTFQQD